MEQCCQAHSKVSKVVVWVYMDQTFSVVLPSFLPPFPALGMLFSQVLPMHLLADLVSTWPPITDICCVSA